MANKSKSSTKRLRRSTEIRCTVASKGAKSKAARKVTLATRSTGSSSKQNTVIGMLRQVKGTTIADIMGATGWQAHSVRGFFAGVIKKKLKMNITSEKTDGTRLYRISRAGAAS